MNEIASSGFLKTRYFGHPSILCSFHHVAAERLIGLNPGCCTRGPHTIDTNRFQMIHHSCFERSFRTNKSIFNPGFLRIGYKFREMSVSLQSLTSLARQENTGIPVSHNGKNFSFTVAGKSTDYCVLLPPPPTTSIFIFMLLSRWQ